MAEKPNEKPPAERVPGVQGLQRLAELTQRIIKVKKSDMPTTKKKR